MGFDVLSFAMGLQAGKSGGSSGGDSGKTVLLAEQTLSGFAYSEEYSAYIYEIKPEPCVLTVGETYHVKWDETEYEVVAQDASAMASGMVAMGNLTSFGGIGNNEPFVINYFPNYGVGLLAFDTETSHKVGIYQKEETSGGDYSDVHFVTFMNEDGSKELYKRPVSDGDDCADPVIRGLISKPIKESTAQYNYTHVGWSASANGALDSNILKAVTADKTVYANFAGVLRYYTVTYLDDDGVTVLKTESLAYGTKPSYKPTKDDYDFVAWTPDVAVTGEMTYTASWKKKAAFATATWAEISAITTAGTTASSFKVGDTRDEVLTYADGTTEEIQLVIAHIREDGTMVLALNHALATARQMNSDMFECKSSFVANDLGKYLTNTVLLALSEDFQSVIRNRQVGFFSYKIRIPSSWNLGAGLTSLAELDTEALDLFTSDASRMRTLGKGGTATTYWIAACREWGSGYYAYYHVSENGAVTAYSDLASGTTESRGLVFLVDV